MRSQLLEWAGKIAGSRAGWYVAAGALVVMFTAIRGCSDNRTERARIQAAVKGSDNTLRAFQAALVSKDEQIRELNRDLDAFSCDGEMQVVERPDGTRERRCVGKATVEKGTTVERWREIHTPEIPCPQLQPVAGPVSTVHVWTWMAAVGGGYSLIGPVGYVRGARRIVGSVGLEAMVLWPPAATAGVVVVW